MRRTDSTGVEGNTFDERRTSRNGSLHAAGFAIISHKDAIITSVDNLEALLVGFAGTEMRQRGGILIIKV
jgi:hypothetical protein